MTTQRYRLALALALTLGALAAMADTPILNGQLSGLSYGDSPSEASSALGEACASSETIVVAEPTFPLAKSDERHLICRGYALGGERIDALALTFADGGLVMINASGNAARPVLALAHEPLGEYLHFKASFKEALIADPVADRAWVLSPQARHPNLFLWTNPYLSGGSAPAPTYSASAQTPELLAFGGRLDDLKAGFESGCAFMSLRTNRVWLLNEPEVQQQIDCFGYVYAGFPRKIEAVFGDGVLEQAWILTGKGEEERVRQALIEAFGDPIHVDADWEVFDGNRVMLRKDKPEVLMLSEKLAPLYRAKYIDED